MKERIKKLKLHSKVLLLAALIGVIVGALDALFGRVLLAITAFRSSHAVWLLPFLGVAGVITIWAYKRFSEESLKGMGLVMQVGFGEEEKIPMLLIPLIMVGTWMTHLFGGSAGREGVAVQLGATISHGIGRKCKVPENSRVLLLTGMAAGFAGLFQTPLTATFFAMEVMVCGAMQYEALLPVLMASFIASTTSHLLGLEKFAVTIPGTISWNGETIVKVVLAAVVFGAVGGIFAYALGKTKKAVTSWIKNPMKRILIIGSLVAAALLLFHMGRYAGLGTNLISASVNGEKIYAYDWLLKVLFTVITLAAGYQGGEVTPLFSIGASLGVVLANVLGLPIVLMAGLGYAAVFGAATNTLIAPILIGIEVFGGSHMELFAIVCMIAYVCNGKQTIYGAQKTYVLTKL